MRRLVCSLGTALLSIGFASAPLAQETEPNGSCLTAQDVELPVDTELVLDGALDQKNADPTTDVDFFRIRSNGGAFVTFSVGERRDVAIGAFDESCKKLLSGVGTTGQILVPPSGAVIVAVADAGDTDFLGRGSKNPGAYQLALSEAPSIGSISGTAVNAATGKPLPFAIVFLDACFESIGCSPVLSLTQADELGQFRFERDAFGTKIGPGLFRLTAGGKATGFQAATSVRFRVDERESLDVGELFLTPNPAPCSQPAN